MVQPSSMKPFTSDLAYGHTASTSKPRSLKDAFCTLDKRNGKVDLERLKTIIKRLGNNYTQTDTESMLRSIRTFQESEIIFNDFLSELDSKTQNQISDEEIAQAFVVFNRNMDGFITVGDLHYVMEILGQKVNEEKLNAIFKEADLDNDGVINCMYALEAWVL